MIDHLTGLILLALAIPLVVVGALWVFSRVLETVVVSRRAQMAIAAVGLVLNAAQVVEHVAEESSRWWIPALGGLVWAAYWSSQIRRASDATRSLSGEGRSS